VGKYREDGTRTHKQTQTGSDDMKSIAERACKLAETALCCAVLWSGTQPNSKLRGSGERQVDLVGLPSKGIQNRDPVGASKASALYDPPAGHISELRSRDPLAARPLPNSPTRSLARPIAARNGGHVCPHASHDHSVVFRSNRAHFRCATHTHTHIHIHMSFSESTEALPD
jgi:hypothetical protein